MRKAVWLSDAIRVWLLVVGALLILTVYPFRIWQRIITETGGGVRMEVSGQIDDGHDLIQDFIAQYDYLDAVDVYVEELSAGRYIDLSVFDENLVQIFHKYLDLGDQTIPGWVRIPLGLETEVGKQYRLFFMGAYAGYRMGLENIPTDKVSPYLLALYVNDTSQPDWHLHIQLRYRQPADRKTSLIWIALIAGITALAVCLTTVIAHRSGRDADRIVTPAEVLRMTLAPLLGLCVLCLLILVVLQRFDYRLSDNAFYFLGIVLAGGTAALFFIPSASHCRNTTDAGSFSVTSVIEWFHAAAFAMAIQASCAYMNGLYDIDHELASRREVIWLSVFFVLFLIGRRPPHTGRMHPRLNLFGVAAALFFSLIILFRNTRMWGITLTMLFLAALVCYRFSPRRERWLVLLTRGLFLHFVCSVVYCLARRYYVAFVSARFPFIFHTVTVTAEYLTMMAAASFALLLAAVIRVPRANGIKGLITEVRSEAVLFGTISAYILFTASRTAFVAVFGSIMLLIPVIAWRRQRRRREGDTERTFGAFAGVLLSLLSALLLFPPVFTMQRILPPMIGRPVYMAVEDAIPDLRGAVNWNSMFLISIERYATVFLDKVANISNIGYDYPEDRFNYDADGYPIYPRVGADDRGWKDGSAGGEAVEVETADSGENDSADEIANGRLTIWKSYLPQINLTGHEEMGVELPDGEMAVHAHDVYLQVLHDHGWIAGTVFALLILFALAAAAMFGRMTGKQPAGGVRFIPFALTAGFAIAGLTEWNFHLGNMMTVAMLASWVPLCFRETKRS
ncbi:MAG: O-antigen ligase family protein [Lachnospiraceae bacterium]|nr:O-antigen ligase family protein [Lachnospiraceae bacterium]